VAPKEAVRWFWLIVLARWSIAQIEKEFGVRIGMLVSLCRMVEGEVIPNLDRIAVAELVSRQNTQRLQ
jgi:hypothetical protein